jgi:hypothetical protein
MGESQEVLLALFLEGAVVKVASDARLEAVDFGVEVLVRSGI